MPCSVSHPDAISCDFNNLAVTGVAAACLFIRSCWRVAELSNGFNGPLTSKEGVFIALDTIPMITMSVLLTILHPKVWIQKDESKPEISNIDWKV
jgi:hypothetical protein